MYEKVLAVEKKLDLARKYLVSHEDRGVSEHGEKQWWGRKGWGDVRGWVGRDGEERSGIWAGQGGTKVM